MFEKFIEAIVRLAAAIEANTAALKGAPSQPAPAPAAETPAAAPAPKAKKTKEAAPAPAETPAAAPAPAPEPAPAPKAPEYPTQEALVDAANKFIELSNPDAMTCFAGIKEKFKVEKVRLVKPEDRAAAIKLIEDAVAAFKAKNAASDV